MLQYQEHLFLFFFGLVILLFCVSIVLSTQGAGRFALLCIHMLWFQLVLVHEKNGRNVLAIAEYFVYSNGVICMYPTSNPGPRHPIM